MTNHIRRWFRFSYQLYISEILLHANPLAPKKTNLPVQYRVSDNNVDGYGLQIVAAALHPNTTSVVQPLNQGRYHLNASGRRSLRCGGGGGGGVLEKVGQGQDKLGCWLLQM